MAESSPYQAFLEKLSQLEQDQSLYESELQTNEELQGLKHEEVIKLGGLMCKRLQKFAEKGQDFADSLPPDFVPKLRDAMVSYQTLIVPPKLFGGFCPCLKPSRDGPEYEKKLLYTKAKMVSVVFLAQAVLIENKGEQHNMDSVQYADYVSKMNIVFKSLDDVKYGNNEKSLEAARKKLLAASEGVDRFVQLFGEYGGKKEFKQEAVRRIRQVQELLNNRPTGPDGNPQPISRRILIKTQSSMQEIMNSAAAISLTQAKDNLKNLESLTKLLKKSRDLELAQFSQMEEQLLEYNLQDELARAREECEIMHSEASVKLKDATKRWTAVKNQSVPRKVVEYDDVAPSSSGAVGAGVANMLNVKPMKPSDIDPTQIFKPMKNFATIISDGAKDAAAKVKDGATKVFSIDGEASSPTVPTPPPPKPLKKSNSNTNNVVTRPAPPTKAKTTNMFNPLESLLGSDA